MMKKIVVLFFFLPSFSFAQSNHPDGWPWRVSDSGAVRVILPELSARDWNKINVGTMLHSSVVSSDSVYRKIFSRFPKDSLPTIDFTKNELKMEPYCMQCLVSCPNINGHIEPCHRNACRYTAFWYIRPKQTNKAGTAVIN